MKTRFTILIIIQLFALTLWAQNGNDILGEYHHTRISTQQSGMLTLGAWAAGNMFFSGAAMMNTTGSTYRFHQMNVFWNVVNFGIAAGGYFGLPSPNEVPSLTTTMNEYHNFNKILLLNAGLDVAYMVGGFYLKEKAKNSENRKALFKGYGNSVILQGAFLFVFDLTLYFINQSHLQGIMQSENWNLAISTAGFGITYSF